ncbi:hypothetical protein J6590_040349 [Homalodisca vitripennis]|nr:hypothetical protein J6590_040348 [Homalodisca vitripennis]KAG8297207.1 hypothetical protein J6590_040349 [Homalodisca vitripennis]
MMTDETAPFFKNIDFESEVQCILVNLTSELTILSSTYPDSSFEELHTQIAVLVDKMDTLRSVYDIQLTSLQSSKSEISLLSSKLDLEKEHRRTELNNSFALQDEAETDIRNLKTRCLDLTEALRDRDLDVAEDQLVKLTKTSVNISPVDKWVEEESINTYINTWSSAAGVKIFLIFDTAISQLLKVGTPESIADTLANSTFFACNFVFFCINDSTDVDRGDSGSHWSLLLLDRVGSQAYHFDSISEIGMSTSPSPNDVCRPNVLKLVKKQHHASNEWSIVKPKRSKKSKHNIKKVPLSYTVEIKNKYAKLASFDSEDDHDVGSVSSVSGVWKTSLQKNVTANFKMSINVESNLRRQVSVFGESDNCKDLPYHNFSSKTATALPNNHVDLRKNVNNVYTNRDSVCVKSSPRYHLAKDGRHLNRSGSFKLGRIMLSTSLKPTSKSSHSHSMEPCPSNDTSQLILDTPVLSVFSSGPSPVHSCDRSPVRTVPPSGNERSGVLIGAT